MDILNYLPLFLSLILTVAVGAYAWRHRQGAGVRVFGYVILAELFWIIGYHFELISPSIRGKIFWDDFQFIGSLFTPLMLMIFAFEFTGLGNLFTRQARISLAVFPILFMMLLYTNPLHGLIRTSTAHIVPGVPFDTLIYDYTLPMWISFIYGYLTYIAATILFIRNLYRQHRLFRTQTLIIVFGFIFPFLGTIPSAANIIVFGQRDVTPYTFGIANLILAWGLFRYGLFDVTPIARDAVMEYMNDVVIVLDMQGRVVDVNRAALFGLEMTANQVIGMHITQLLKERPDLIEFFEGDESVRGNVTYTSPSGKEFVLSSYISPLRDQQNKVIGRLLVARDITDERKMQVELRRAYDELEIRVQRRTAELEQANKELEQKNAELERFTYSVSHDLKSPLITISGYLGYLKEDIVAGNVERLEKDTQRIANAVDKMDRLLTDVLELSRIGRVVNPSETLRIEEIIAEAVEAIRGRLDARGVSVQIQTNLPLVHGDKARLTEVLQNLIDNSAKFMGDQSNPEIIIGFIEENNNKPIFFVKDNGMGIASEFHERIFGLFNRLDPQIEGTGVGLALVKRIIEIHGGRIWVESEVGNGSTFYFTLGG